MIAHHKKPLSRVISRAHQLLEIAKNEGGRNSVALELDKRAGGGRLFVTGWKDMDSSKKKPILHHFMSLAMAMQNDEKNSMSTSLAYRLGMFKDGLIPIINKPELMKKFIAKQLDRSNFPGAQAKSDKISSMDMIAENVSDLLVHQTRATGELHAESLILANFLGKCQKDRIVADVTEVK